METDKPLISVLLAVYEPRLDWLREQLLSLNEQTYPKIKLYVRDDCSEKVPFDEICACVHECIKAFSYEISRNEVNMGSNKTFELLTKETEGTYLAYCDQDDVWEKTKLERLEGYLAGGEADLVCTDVIPIDAQGEVLAESITQLRPRHVFKEGTDCIETLVYRNYVIGCTMLVRADRAKEALPFAEHMVHDHYLAFFCAIHAGIALCPEHLVRYRLHGNNQTGVLARVSDRDSYYENYILPFCARMEELNKRFSCNELKKALSWAYARKENAQHLPGAARRLWKLRVAEQKTSLFEVVGFRLPECVFSRLLKLIQSGKI